MPLQTTNKYLNSNTPQPLGTNLTCDIVENESVPIATTYTMVESAGEYVTVKQYTDNSSFVISAGPTLREKLIRDTNAKLGQQGFSDQLAIISSTKTR